MDLKKQEAPAKASKPTDYSEKYSERWHQADPDEFADQLHMSWEKWALCAEQFASSIELAHRVAPDRWGLTDRGDHIRHNVGMVEAVVANRAWLQVMVDRPAFESARIEPEAGIFEIDPREQHYRSTPNAAYVYLSLDDRKLVARCESIQTAHREQLRAAVSTRRHPVTRQGHHPGLVDAIAATVSRPLPQPSYVHVERPPGVEPQGKLVPEGRKLDVIQTKYERNGRAVCLEAHGYSCVCCDRTLESEYGPEAAGLIHVHHLVSFEESPGERQTDPIRDLRPVCPNCHIVIHSRRPMYTIEEVRALRANAR